MSNVNKAIKMAAEKGFSIDKEGNVFRHGSPIKPCFHKGYKHFSVVISPNKQISVPFHRFQGYHKFGLKIFKPEIAVRHLNGDRTDNSWNNMGIGTHLDNMRDIPKEARLQVATNASHTRWPNQPDAAAMLLDKENGMHWKDIAKKYGTSRSNTHRLLVKQRNLKSF